MTDMYLFTDVETTGFKKKGLVVPGQARVCQSAAILTDEKGKTITEFCSLIKPSSPGEWKISDGAYAVNGIFQGDCDLYGIPQAQFVYMFLMMAGRATRIIAHNEKFDKGMMDVEIAYLNPSDRDLMENYKMKPWYCTMENNKGLEGGKSLANCLRHWCNKEIENAHDAMADTRACRDVFFGMRGVQL